MAKRLSHISLSLFVTWLYRRRVMGGWQKLDELHKDWPFGERIDPWLAIAHWISRNTGFQAHVVEEYMRNVSRSAPNTIDPYVSRELFKWWEDGAGKKLIVVFWDAYPEVAESMQYLPKPVLPDSNSEENSKATAITPKKTVGKKPVKRKKRAKQPPRTEFTEREKQVKKGLAATISKKALAKHLGVDPSRISQLIKQIEEVEANAASRSKAMGAMVSVRDDYSADAPPNKRTHRQRK
jgi:hypothetical protein